MKTKNAIVCPLIYKGTSFEDIVVALKASAKKSGLKIDFIGGKRFQKNTLKPGLLDDEAYVKQQVKLLGKLTKTSRYEKILFLDFFQPGLDLVKYSFEQKGTKCKMGSLLHGGSFMSGDLYSWNWLSRFEQACAGIYDVVYVPSKYLKSKAKVLKGPSIRVFPWGMNDVLVPVKNRKKDIDVVFPHRLDTDKGVDDLIEIIKKLPQLKFAITCVRSQSAISTNPYAKKIKKFKNVIILENSSNKEYLQQLSRAKLALSCAKQETFGYAMMKAVAVGCLPVAPNNVSYPEFFDKKFLYKNNNEAVEKILMLISSAAEMQKQKISMRNKIEKYSFSPMLKEFFE